MRSFCALFMVVASAAAFGQAKLIVKINGKPAGQVTVSARIAATGEKIDEISGYTLAGKTRTDIRVLSSFDAKGVPKRKFFASNVAGTSERHQMVATFDGAGARVQFLPAGDGAAQALPFPTDLTAIQVSEFWFIRDHPKPGTTVTSAVFEFDAGGKWTKQVATYVGDVAVSVAGKQVRAHKVTATLGDRSIVEYLDDAGLPYKIVQGTLVYERTNL